MRKISVMACLLLAGGWQQLNAFCGFYAAQAGTNVFNKKSEVIIARNGNHTTLTMRNDFKGDLKNFAMIIPVPVVLKRNDITIKEQSLFDALDKYSAPRIAEYFDQNPCNVSISGARGMDMVTRTSSAVLESNLGATSKYKSVKIEAQYSIDEYEIVILSATESSGLENWLNDNGYALPDRAKEVLEPYIKDKMKFFAVKVNMEKAKNLANGYLRPIQISFNSPKFMLPIRLGMANANGEQDLVIYIFSKTGRIEAANYRTVEMPSARNVPTFLKETYGDFYKSVFEKKYNEEGRKAVFLEYAWNVSPSWSGYHCDPCVGNPPVMTELTQSGVDWVDQNSTGNVFFTRLHVRYSREKFPEDLTFIETPNVEHFQVRQVIRHAASGSFDCDAGLIYMADLKNRRQLELDEMETLSGWHAQSYPYYVLTGSGKKVEFQEDPQNQQDKGFLPLFSGSGGNPPFYMLPVLLLVVVGLLGIPRWLLRAKKV